MPYKGRAFIIDKNYVAADAECGAVHLHHMPDDWKPEKLNSTMKPTRAYP
jgi:hypothetical protein